MLPYGDDRVGPLWSSQRSVRFCKFFLSILLVQRLQPSIVFFIPWKVSNLSEWQTPQLTSHGSWSFRQSLSTWEACAGMRSLARCPNWYSVNHSILNCLDLSAVTMQCCQIPGKWQIVQLLLVKNTPQILGWKELSLSRYIYKIWLINLSSEQEYCKNMWAWHWSWLCAFLSLDILLPTTPRQTHHQIHHIPAVVSERPMYKDPYTHANIRNPG